MGDIRFKNETNNRVEKIRGEDNPKQRKRILIHRVKGQPNSHKLCRLKLFSQISRKIALETSAHFYHLWIDQLLNEGKTVQVPVYGMSMFPILLPRDKVQIQKCSLEALKIGQVLVFDINGQWIAHRLTGKDAARGLLFTKGDGLPYTDAPVTIETTKGVITKVIKSRSPLAWSINTPIDQFMVWAGPVLGRLFVLLARLTEKILRTLNRNQGPISTKEK
jgi:hypothetical protein